MNKIAIERTPYYLIDKNKIESGLFKLKSALDNSWGNYLIGYSYKTNTLPWIIDYFNRKGCYAEVVSDDEYFLATSIGVEKNHVIYNGVAKSKDSFIDAIRNHAIVNIDSEYEIDWLDEIDKENCAIGIRVNFDLEAACPGQTQCGEDGERFGFCYENGELKRAIDRIESKGVRVTGLHLHKSSKTRMPDIYQAIAETAVKITRQFKLNLSYVDIGGGFFGGLETKPQFQEYFEMIGRILRQQFDSKLTSLIVEPGMALIGAPIDYVTTVVDVKKTTRNTFVVTDGSRTHIDPLMKKTSYCYSVEKDKRIRKNVTRQIVSGFTCMEHDRIFDLMESEELLPGDKIIYHKVGAYTMCLSPLFIKWYPDVYVCDKDKVHKVRNRWTSESCKSGSLKEE